MSRYLAQNQQPPMLYSQILAKLKNIESLSLNSHDEQSKNLLLLYEEVRDLERLVKQYICDPQEMGAPDIDEPTETPPLSLTPKEEMLLSLFAKGFSYQESANYLDCKLSTIQTHAKKIYKKLGVHSRAEAVHEALLVELLQP